MFTDIQNLFLKQHGSFARWLQFETIVVFVIVLVVLTQAFEKNYGFVIILLVFAFYVTNTYVSVKNDKINDFNSITMVKLQKLQSKMILQVHDELIFDVLPHEKDVLAHLVKNGMQNAVKLNVPLDVEMNFGENWLDAH
jgi:hypothetical protein